MGQRLGIAAALLGDPQVLMFDEPVNGLDPEGILWIRNLMQALAAEGRTVFVSSHLMSEMALTADHLSSSAAAGCIADAHRRRLHRRQLRRTHVRVRTPRPASCRDLLPAPAPRSTTTATARWRSPAWPRRAIGDLAPATASRCTSCPPQGLAGGGVHGADRGQRGVPAGYPSRLDRRRRGGGVA